MTRTETAGGTFWFLVVGLLLLHFLLRPVLSAWVVAPDLLAGGVLLGALRLRAGHAAIVGFLAGGLEGAMALDGMGILALLHAALGYLGARSWDLFFADVGFFLPVYLFLGTFLLHLAAGILTGPAPTWSYAALEAPASAGLTALLCGGAATLTERRP